VPTGSSAATPLVRPHAVVVAIATMSTTTDLSSLQEKVNLTVPVHSLQT
jgi:hypothetical protein